LKRRDVLQLHINRRPLRRLVESDASDRAAAADEFQVTRSTSVGNHQVEEEKAD
jgi:hypothetical protein